MKIQWPQIGKRLKEEERLVEKGKGFPEVCACARVRARACAPETVSETAYKEKENKGKCDRERQRNKWEKARVLGEGPAPGEAERMDAGMQAERAGGGEAHMCERDSDVSISFWIGHVVLAR